MSNTSDPVDYRPKVCKGEKGRLINVQDNPRNVEEVDYMRDFQNCMGGPAKVEEAILAKPAIFQGHEDFQSTSYPQEKSRCCACSSASMQCGE